MELSTVFSQRDPRWATARLGAVPGLTISGYGCYLTSFAMLASRRGHPVTPLDLNALLVAADAFIQGNLLADSSLARVFPDCAYQGTAYYGDGPADLDRLAALLADPAVDVILELDFDHDVTDGIQTHFVLAVGLADGVPVVADPWYGTVEPLTAHYGPDPAQVIQKFVLYRSPVPAEVPAEAPPEQTAEEDEMALSEGQRTLLAAVDEAGVDPAEAAEEVKTLHALNADHTSVIGWIQQIGALQAQQAPRRVATLTVTYDDGSTQDVPVTNN